MVSNPQPAADAAVCAAPVMPTPALALAERPWRSLTPQQRARIALMRFGLGPKPDTPPEFWSGNGDDLYEALMHEINHPEEVVIPDRSMNAKDVTNSIGWNTGILATADNVAVDQWLNNHPAHPASNKIDLNGVPTLAQCGQSMLGEQHLAWIQADIRARYRKAQAPVIGFAERLVLFWSNHFSIYWGKDIYSRGSTGYCERKAIRPYVLGSFPEMLKQVIQQPAMITYLDNNHNIGPETSWYFEKQRHIIENLAREVLELHTVGREANYTQDDVMELARVLTGFTLTDHGFSGYWWSKHQQGPRTILCHTFPQTYWDPDTHAVRQYDNKSTEVQNRYNMSPQQGLNVLDFLATRPETARHLATKLIRHFVSETPSSDSVNILAEAYMEDAGGLRGMTSKLLALPEAWRTKPVGWPNKPFNKPGRMRTPQLSLLAMNRALGLTDWHINVTTSMTTGWEGPFEEYLAGMNHFHWGRLTPDGYPDDSAYWRTENTMRLRKDLTYRLLKRLNARLNTEWNTPFQLPDAHDLALQLFPNGGISDESLALTRTMSGDRAANLTLLFMTYEYLRR